MLNNKSECDAGDASALRIDMAAGFRWLDKWNMSDLVAGSIVARLPGEVNWLLTHAHDRHFDEICASDMVKVNHQAEVLEGTNQRVNFAAVNPAAWVFRQNPDVNCIIHAHSTAVMAVSALKSGLLYASEPAFMFYKKLAYLDADFHFDDAYCKSVAAAVGDNMAVIYRNHAFATWGSSVHEAMLRAYMLDQACQIQLKAQATDQEVIVPDDAEKQRHYDAFFGNPKYVYDGSLEWSGMIRRLDREDPSYRD